MIRTKFLKIFQPYFCEDIIRLGKDNDGGYLVNKQDILKSKKLISLGVGDDVSFEMDFMKLNDCPITAFDGTIDPNQEFVKNFYTGNKTFINKNIGNKKEERAHRISYRLHKGPIPKDIVVRHKCDVRLCVNPDHLELGTHQDNMNDMKNINLIDLYVRKENLQYDKIDMECELETLQFRETLLYCDMNSRDYKKIKEDFDKKQIITF